VGFAEIAHGRQGRSAAVSLRLRVAVGTESGVLRQHGVRTAVLLVALIAALRLQAADLQ
jgi:hypothetical protein